MTARARTAIALAGALLAGCAGGRGHPVRQSLPRLAPGEVPLAGPAGGEPGAPSAAAAAAFLFRGLEGVLRPLERFRRLPVPDPRRPVLVTLPRMEAAVLARHRSGGYGGAVRIVVAVAATGHLPRPPEDVARLMQDAAVERRLLEADTFRSLGHEYDLPGASRSVYLVEMRRVGRGPLRFDLRFGFAAERWDAPDGRILVRYDPRPSLRPEHVTLYRGGCLIEPTATGARLTELLILGTDIRVPFFLEDAVREVTRDKLSRRAQGLWTLAWADR